MCSGYAERGHRPAGPPVRGEAHRQRAHNFNRWRWRGVGKCTGSYVSGKTEAQIRIVGWQFAIVVPTWISGGRGFFLSVMHDFLLELLQNAGLPYLAPIATLTSDPRLERVGGIFVSPPPQALTD